MDIYNINDKRIEVFQYTLDFKKELISEGVYEFEDIYYIIIENITNIKFEWNFIKKELKIIYDNNSSINSEIVNIDDYIIRDEYGKYHIESKEDFEQKINKLS